MAAFVPAGVLPVTARRSAAVSTAPRMGAEEPKGHVSRAAFVRLIVGTGGAAAAAGFSGGVMPAQAGLAWAASSRGGTATMPSAPWTRTYVLHFQAGFWGV